MVAIIIQLVVVLLMVEKVTDDKSVGGVQECAGHAGWR